MSIWSEKLDALGKTAEGDAVTAGHAMARRDTIRNEMGRAPMTPWRPPLAPAYVYLLADNLDAALAAGEDLLKETFVWNGASQGTPSEIDAALAEQRAAIGTIRSLEMFVVARVLKARERAEELGRRDERFQRICKLFSGGTALLIEAAAELGDQSSIEFDTGDALTPYLRGRGLLAADQSSPPVGASIEMSEDFLIARRIRLGDLMDLVASFLDTLELHYELFAASDDAAADGMSADDLQGESGQGEPGPDETGSGTPSAV